MTDEIVLTTRIPVDDEGRVHLGNGDLIDAEYLQRALTEGNYSVTFAYDENMRILGASITPVPSSKWSG